MTTSNSENSQSNEESPAAANIPAKSNRLVWIDLEMTGLDPKQHVIVEVAALVTDANLNILGDGYSAVIHASAEELAKMDDVVVRMHQASGLDKEIAESTTSIGDAAGRFRFDCPTLRSGLGRSAGWQLDCYRSPVYPGIHAEVRRAPALPHGGCLHNQRTFPPLVPAGVFPAAR